MSPDRLPFQPEVLGLRLPVAFHPMVVSGFQVCAQLDKILEPFAGCWESKYRDVGDCEEVLARFAAADIDDASARLDEQERRHSSKSRNDLMAVIESKSAVLQRAIAN